MKSFVNFCTLVLVVTLVAGCSKQHDPVTPPGVEPVPEGVLRNTTTLPAEPKESMEVVRCETADGILWLPINHCIMATQLENERLNAEIEMMDAEKTAIVDAKFERLNAELELKLEDPCVFGKIMERLTAGDSMEAARRIICSKFRDRITTDEAAALECEGEEAK